MAYSPDLFGVVMTVVSQLILGSPADVLRISLVPNRFVLVAVLPVVTFCALIGTFADPLPRDLVYPDISDRCSPAVPADLCFIVSHPAKKQPAG